MIGSILLTIALILSLFSFIMYYMSLRGAGNTLNIARLAYNAMTLFVIVSSVLLLYYILSHHYEYGYIYSNSDNSLPLGYLISTFWAGQEGSFLFWILLTALTGVFVMSYTAKREEWEAPVMLFFTLAITFLLVMVSPIMKNPFAYIWSDPTFVNIGMVNKEFYSLPFLDNFFFQDNSGANLIRISKELAAELHAAGISFNEFLVNGRGLNPLLQNFWMQIHPPILFAGFALATVPFSFAAAGLVRRKYKEWLGHALPWMLALSGILGMGIMLGGYWAYGVLGWGGYWAWDPVENSSLVPWLVSAAVIHTMIAQYRSQKRGDGKLRFVKTNFALTLFIFVLVIYSTFLTRSGILSDASVHSFVSAGALVYWFLIIFISGFLLMSIILLAIRWKEINELVTEQSDMINRETALFWSTLAIGASAIIVLVGTSVPIFGIIVEISFYNMMHLPLAIIFGLLNAYSFLVTWGKNDTSSILKKAQVSFGISFIATIALVIIASVSDVLLILLIFSAMFTIVINLEVMFGAFKSDWKKIGAYIAHIGLGIFILGVIGSSVYDTETELDLKQGETYEALGHKFTYTGYEPFDNNQKYAFQVSITQGSDSVIAKPVMYISSFNNSIMREPSILEGFTKDLYISPLAFEDGTGQQSQDEHIHQLTISPDEVQMMDEIRVTYKSFIKPDMKAMTEGGDFEMGVNLLLEKDDVMTEEKVVLVNSGGRMAPQEVDVPELGIKIALITVSPTSKQASIKFLFEDKKTHTMQQENKPPVLSISAAIKPYVSLVWIGTLLMFFGFMIAMYKRMKMVD